MKKLLYPFVIFLFVAGSIPRAQALQSGSPEEALEEIVTADSVEAVIKHLPVKVQEFVEKLPKQQKAALTDEFLVHKKLEREGGKLTRSDDGSWELVEKENGPKVTLTLKKTFIAGTDALVQIEIKEERHAEKHTNLIMLGMRYENDEWRLSEVGEWRGTDIEAEFLRKEGLNDDHSNSSAASMLRVLNTSLVTYSTTYPEVGYPANLKALSGEENQQPSPEHAALIDPAFLKDPAIKNGYEFRYTRIGSSGYQITATPLQYGQGQESFFTDETAVIRFTKESRPAMANDTPLD
jgi:hypothetical protein